MLGPIQFHYPVTLTTLHLGFQTLATRVLHQFTNLISGPPPLEEESLLPLNPTGMEELESGEEEGEKVKRGNWKEESVAITFSEYKRMMYVTFLLSLFRSVRFNRFPISESSIRSLSLFNFHSNFPLPLSILMLTLL